MTLNPAKTVTFDQLKADSETLKDLQTELARIGFYKLEIDGIWGEGTELALKQASEKYKLNNFEKQVIGKSFITKLLADTAKPVVAPKYDLSPVAEADFQALAKSLNLEVALLKAVAEVESSGRGLQDDGRPVVRFESHVFSSMTNRKFDSSHPKLSTRKYSPLLNSRSSEGEYLRLEAAMLLDREAALQSASFGAFQIMGFNYEVVGYPTVEEFFQAMHSPKDQLKALGQFLVRNALVVSLRRKDFKGFARSYNGPAYNQHRPPYDERILTAYEKHLKNI
jgi:hypothetical protein